MKTVKRFDPLSVAKIAGILYFAMGLLFFPFILVASFVSSHAAHGANGFPVAFGLGFALFAPFLYGAIGFMAGIIGAFLYNIVARFVGGIKVEVE